MTSYKVIRYPEGDLSEGYTMAVCPNINAARFIAKALRYYVGVYSKVRRKSFATPDKYVVRESETL